MMKEIAIQDLYPAELAHCFGCGSLNEQGHQLKTYFKTDHTISHFKVDPKYIAIPGGVYGGLIASLFDCHGTASAAAFACLHNGLAVDVAPLGVRCVTGNLSVNFKAMTPMGHPLEIRGVLKEISGRKITVEMTLTANGILCATAEILAISLK